MGRRSIDDSASGLEFLGLVDPVLIDPVAAQPALSSSWSFGQQAETQQAAAPAQPALAQPAPTQPAPAPPLTREPGLAPPLTRREARERENAAAQPITYVAERLQPQPQAAEQSTPVRPEPLGLPPRAVRQAPVERRDQGSPRARAAASPRSRGARSAPRASSKVLSLAALLFTGALVVGMSVPANAFMTGDSPVTGTAPIASTVGDQTVDVSASAAASTPARDTFDVIDYSEISNERFGSLGYSVTTGAVRFPFPYPVPISDGFGPRIAPCDSGCSTMHLGVDFTPGAGTPIYAIADGVVTTHEDDNGSFGNHVIISHLINGQHIDSLYAHMQAGSSPIVEGQTVKVGDFLGLVGETGEAVGAHLHFEIHLDGVAIDPFAWLIANAVN